LLAFCRASGLIILNGRLPDGGPGEATRRNPTTAASVIDMVLISPEILTLYELKIYPDMTHLSTDHNPLILTIRGMALQRKDYSTENKEETLKRREVTFRTLEEQLAAKNQDML